MSRMKFSTSLIVVYHKDIFIALNDKLPWRSYPLNDFAGDRDIDSKGCPFAFRALHGNISLVVFYDAVNRCEAKSRALAFLLRGKERIEDPVQNFLRDAAAGIGYGEFDIFARSNAGWHIDRDLFLSRERWSRP